MNQLEVVLTVSGSDYYLSDVAHIGQDGNFYQEWIVEPPKLKLGPVKGGHVAPQIGGFRIAKDLIDSNHPFFGSRFTTVLATPGPYVMKLYHGTKYPLFEGSITLSGISDQFMDFSIQPKEHLNGAGNVPVALKTTVEYTANVGSGNASSTVFDPRILGTVTDKGPHYLLTPINYVKPFAGRLQFSSAYEIERTASPTYTVKMLNYGDLTMEDPTSTAIKEFYAPLDTNSVPKQSFLVGGNSFDPQTKTLVSGVSKYGSSVQDFFDMACGDYDYAAHEFGNIGAVDITRASSSSSRNISIYQSDQMLLIDWCAEVAEATNYLFQIKPNPSSGVETCYIIDRAYSATATTLNDSQVVQILSKFEPFAKVQGTYKVQRFKGETQFFSGFGVDSSTSVSGGTGHTNGTYADLPIAGGTGQGCRATIVVSGGAVSGVTITQPGYGYETGDTMTINKDDIGGGGSNETFNPGGLGTYNIFTNMQEFEEIPVEVQSVNLTAGKTKTVKVYADRFDAVSAMETILDAIRDVEKKPRASITIDGVKSSYEIGDRFVYNSREDFVKYDLFTESIEWDFSNRQTTVSGHSSLTPYEAA